MRSFIRSMSFTLLMPANAIGDIGRLQPYHSEI